MTKAEVCLVTAEMQKTPRRNKANSTTNPTSTLPPINQASKIKTLLTFSAAC